MCFFIIIVDIRNNELLFSWNVQLLAMFYFNAAMMGFVFCNGVINLEFSMTSLIVSTVLLPQLGADTVMDF